MPKRNPTRAKAPKKILLSSDEELETPKESENNSSSYEGDSAIESSDDDSEGVKSEELDSDASDVVEIDSEDSAPKRTSRSPKKKPSPRSKAQKESPSKAELSKKSSPASSKRGTKSEAKTSAPKRAKTESSKRNVDEESNESDEHKPSPMKTKKDSNDEPPTSAKSKKPQIPKSEASNAGFEDIIQKYSKDQADGLVCRDGAVEGDVVIGTILNNRFLQVKIIKGTVQPVVRKGYLLRGILASDAFISKNSANTLSTSSHVVPWKVLEIMCGPHMNWPRLCGEEDMFLSALGYLLQSLFSDLKGRIPSAIDRIVSQYMERSPSEEMKVRWRDHGWDFKNALLPPHAPMSGVLVQIIEPGEGTHAGVFESLMSRAQEHYENTGTELYYSYEDIGLAIAKFTGDPNVTFFMTLSAMKHLVERPYTPPRYSPSSCPTGYDILKDVSDFEQKYMNMGSAASSSTTGQLDESKMKSFPKYFTVSMSEGGTPVTTWTKTLIGPKKSEPGFISLCYEIESLPGIGFVYHGPADQEGYKSLGAEKRTLSHGLLKSLIQKATRRCKADDALAAFEALLRSPPSFNPTLQRGMRALPESLLRLFVIAVEDAGLCLEVSAVAWMALVSYHVPSWAPTKADMMFLRRFTYQMASSAKRSLFSPLTMNVKNDPGSIQDLSKWPSDKDKSWSMPPEHLAIAVALELRTTCPGMEGDKVMLRVARRDIMTIHFSKGVSTIPTQYPESKVPPLSVLESQPIWSLDVALRTPQAVDFHAYPMIVDLLLDADPLVYTHYSKIGLTLSKTLKKGGTAVTHKTSAAAALRLDMWEYSSGINLRDATAPMKSDFWKKNVEALYLILTQNHVRSIR